jgi:hypothetical protein
MRTGLQRFPEAKDNDAWRARRVTPSRARLNRRDAHRDYRFR